MKRGGNKNPNCNHNSNFVFYQPIYNNVKYDDTYKKKEDVLRKAFFKECLKEEENKGAADSLGKGSSSNRGLLSDPVFHIRIVEEVLSNDLFPGF